MTLIGRMPANVTIRAETMNERPAQYPCQIHDVLVVYNIYRIVLPLVLLVSSVGPSLTLLGVGGCRAISWSRVETNHCSAQRKTCSYRC